MPPAAIIGAKVAGGLLAAKAAKKSLGGGSAGSPAADLQAQIAEQLFQQTDPLRTSLIDRSQSYLTNGVDSSPQFSAFKASAEPQFATAKNNVIANTPAGGALVSALTQLEADRARTLTQARGAIDESELARAMTLATGTTGTSVGALGTAASIQAAQAQAEADREAGILGALGTGAGAYLGSKD